MIELVPATMRRCVSDHLLRKGRAALAARFSAELAAVRDCANGIAVFRLRRKPRGVGR